MLGCQKAATQPTQLIKVGAVQQEEQIVVGGRHLCFHPLIKVGAVQLYPYSLLFGKRNFGSLRRGHTFFSHST
jgi:hypothetical protein